MIDKILTLTPLFDLYQTLLTEKQQAYFRSYYESDLSLAEIAENQNVSRNAVHDTLKKVEKLLFEYEEKLKLKEKQDIRNKLIEQYKETKNEALLEELMNI